MSIEERRTTITAALRTETPETVDVPSHLAVAVLCAHVFFRPLGTAAVVCAGNVRTRLALGDVEGARRASRMAALLCWASAAVTMACLVVIAILASGFSTSH